MVPPVVVARDQHTLSRRDIDSDALKVLYRLHHANHLAYLVGGSVRDLLLGRRPKDFDIGTSAHPYQVKKLFRNCWIIGRRFRLAHVKFGNKTIEVATFRKQVPAGSEVEPPLPHEPPAGVELGPPDEHGHHLLVHRDNTFGTPEEDAFRRDFTINALFYDIGTFSIIDHTGGLADLRAGVLRSIGEPGERFLEDPVRMLRAVVLSARLGFAIDPPIFDAIGRHRAEITRSAPARLVEEYYKILRSGHAADAFRTLGDVGLLEHITPEIPARLPAAFERALRALDRYRAGFTSIPESLTNPILLGTLVAPLGLFGRRGRRPPDEGAPRLTLGVLPVARRDVERLAQLLGLQRRLLDVDAPVRAQRALLNRPAFGDALTWLEIHGDAPDTVAHWKTLLEEHAATATVDAAPPRRRRRRRRRPFPDGQV